MVSDWYNRRHTEKNQDQILIPTKNGYTVIPAENLRRKSDSKPLKVLPGIQWGIYRIKDNFKFVFLMMGMLAILTYIGHALAGILGLLAIGAVGGLGFWLSSHIQIHQLLKQQRVRLIQPSEGRPLYQMTAKLVEAAGLTRMPRLYLGAGPELNAYTVEDKNESAIVISEGLLHHLTPRELNGVLAHEIAHLKNHDIKLMLATDQIRRISGFLAIMGQILLMLNLPLLIMGYLVVPWILVIALITAPMVSLLFQVALSRNRELKADLDAVAISDDPVGLARALRKISIQTNAWKRLYAPYLKTHAPDMLRTHPATGDRIRRLEAIQREQEEHLDWTAY